MRSDIYHNCDVACEGHQERDHINNCDYGMRHHDDNCGKVMYTVEHYVIESGNLSNLVVTI